MLTQNQAGRGRIVYDVRTPLRIVEASPKQVTVVFHSTSGNDPGARFSGKRYAYRWDGTGYTRRGRYLTTEES